MVKVASTATPLNTNMTANKRPKRLRLAQTGWRRARRPKSYIATRLLPVVSRATRSRLVGSGRRVLVKDGVSLTFSMKPVPALTAPSKKMLHAGVVRDGVGRGRGRGPGAAARWGFRHIGMRRPGAGASRVALFFPGIGVV